MAFGRFERTPGQTPMREINVTPLVDVMMVLLVIFILTAPLLGSALKLDLPQAQGASASAAAQAVRLSVDAQGQVFLDDQPMALDALAQALKSRAAQAIAAGQAELPEVQLQADTQVPYGRVVEVMDLAQLAGLNRMGFVTQRKPDTPKP
jgi:biopolymer transport protein TolR